MSADIIYWERVMQRVYILDKISNRMSELQEPLLYLNANTVFLYAGLRIASKMMASVLTSRTEQLKGG